MKRMLYEIFWITVLSDAAKLSIFSFRSLHELLLESTVWGDPAFSKVVPLERQQMCRHILAQRGGSSLLLHLCSLLKMAALGSRTTPSCQPEGLNLFMHTLVLSFLVWRATVVFSSCPLLWVSNTKTLQHKDSPEHCWFRVKLTVNHTFLLTVCCDSDKFTKFA